MNTRLGTMREALDWLRKGEPVALPTETVYGLAADALNPQAVAKIFEAKERPFFDPLIVHIPDEEILEHIAHVPKGGAIRELMNAFWPGPLTLVFPKRPLVPDIVTSGHETVAVRMPAHPIFRGILRAFRGALAAPSANRFGRISPTRAEHVLSELSGRIPLVVDGGFATHGVESTIVAVDGDVLNVLRNGPITPEELSRFGEVHFHQSSESHPVAPGQLKSHYAPSTPLQLVDDASNFEPLGGIKCGLLAWNPVETPERFAAIEMFSESHDLREAANRVFAAMRRLDEAGLDLIIAERVPAQGIGHAILDRLAKAAALG